jgi:hypothetical protein
MGYIYLGQSTFQNYLIVLKCLVLILPNATECREIVESLQYYTLTRPDIAYSENQSCQFMHYPTTSHWIAAKQVFRYLKALVHHRFFWAKAPFFLMYIVIQIGLKIQMMDNVPRDVPFFLVHVSSAGVQRSSSWCPSAAPRLNTN